MELKELLIAVKDENLSLSQLEKYRDELIHLETQLLVRRSDLQKMEALYFMDSKIWTEPTADVVKKRHWRVTKEGQELIELDAYKSALPKEIKSLESRVYAQLRIR